MHASWQGKFLVDLKLVVSRGRYTISRKDGVLRNDQAQNAQVKASECSECTGEGKRICPSMPDRHSSW